MSDYVDILNQLETQAEDALETLKTCYNAFGEVCLKTESGNIHYKSIGFPDHNIHSLLRSPCQRFIGVHQQYGKIYASFSCEEDYDYYTSTICIEPDYLLEACEAMASLHLLTLETLKKEVEADKPSREDEEYQTYLVLKEKYEAIR